MAEKNAKQSLTQKILETESNSKLIDSLADKFNLKFNVNLIEVYDNSHTQGTDSVGALIAFGKDGFEKKRYRKFNIKSETIKNDDRFSPSNISIDNETGKKTDLPPPKGAFVRKWK